MLSTIMDIVEREHHEKRGCLGLLVTNRLESLSLTFVAKQEDYGVPCSTVETAIQILNKVPDLQNSVKFQHY